MTNPSCDRGTAGRILSSVVVSKYRGYRMCEIIGYAIPMELSVMSAELIAIKLATVPTKITNTL